MNVMQRIEHAQQTIKRCQTVRHWSAWVLDEQLLAEDLIREKLESIKEDLDAIRAAIESSQWVMQEFSKRGDT